jgi:LAS superfamily LD-carboxypeptidase LdcB
MSERETQIISTELLLGVSDAKLILMPEFNSFFHPQVVAPLLALSAAATAAGFSLQVASSYRNFERQLSIWNNKARGVRPVLDAHGQSLDMALLNDKEKIFAILRWSALPGASRHHWGTDFDVYDISSITSDYSVQLTVEETQGDGPFAKFHQWLNTELMNKADGFYRPYMNDIGGIAPEPWHLSYAPIANIYAAQMSEAIVRAQLQATDIALKETLLENLAEIYQRFIQPYCKSYT